MAEGSYNVELLMFHTEKFKSIITTIRESFVEYRKLRMDI